jgi:hypothetical protein
MPGRSRVVVLVVLLSGCNGIPSLRLPQVEQATEAVHDRGERYRVHHTCADGARSVDEMVACMRAAGWEFVDRGPDYPQAGCWEARDAGELERLVPLCFVRSPEHAGGAPPEAAPDGR